jgi:hypothetical protein
LMNRLATSSSFWGGWDFFLLNNRLGDRRCPASSFADGDFLLLHNPWGEILESRGMLNTTKCFLLTWTNHNHGRLQRKCRSRAEIQPIRHAAVHSSGYRKVKLVTNI